MRILHILDHSIPLHSGYTFRTLAILKEQRALGWETFHVTSTKHIRPGAAEEEVDGWHFYRTPKHFRFAGRLPILNQIAVVDGLARRVANIVQAVKPDILHAHSPALNAIPAMIAARKASIPVVYEVRAFWEDAAVDHGTSSEWGVRYRLTRALENFALRRVDAITTICEGLRNDMIGRGIAPEKITTIPNAVDIEKFSASRTVNKSLKEQLGLGNKRIMGFIGSFYAYEGLDILLQALPIMLPQHPDLRVLLVGGGPQDEQLRQLASRLGIGDKVVFTSRVPHDKVQDYYDLIDILVYPRLSMRLTDLVTPLKPLEAMAQGRVLAASDVGGHQELICDGHNGILFKSGDPNSLAQKVGELINTPDRWENLRRTGREFVETERNWRKSVARYQLIYSNLLSKQEDKK